MKHKILFMLLVQAFVVELAQTQNYVPFPTADAVWLVRQSMVMGGTGYTYVLDIQYEMTAADTTVNNKVYSKIFKRTAHGGNYSVVPTTSVSANAPDLYIGAVREDSNQVVYFLDTLGTEHLLMDFGVTVGEGISPYQANCPIGITHQDSLLVGSAYRQQHHYQQIGSCSAPPYYLSFVDGIGYLTGGLFETAGIYQLLYCFKANNQVLYTSEGNCFEIYPYGATATTSTMAEAAVRLYPNPIHNDVYVEMPFWAQIRVYNVWGQLVTEKQGTNVVHFDTNNWQTGVYVLVVSDKNNNLVKQFKIMK